MPAHPATIRRARPVEVGGCTAVAVVEPRHLNSVADKGIAKVVVASSACRRRCPGQQQLISDGTEALVSDLDAVVVGSERSHRLPVDIFHPAFTETLSRCNTKHESLK